MKMFLTYVIKSPRGATMPALKRYANLSLYCMLKQWSAYSLNAMLRNAENWDCAPQLINRDGKKQCVCERSNNTCRINCPFVETRDEYERTCRDLNRAKLCKQQYWAKKVGRLGAVK